MGIRQLIGDRVELYQLRNRVRKNDLELQAVRGDMTLRAYERGTGSRFRKDKSGNRMHEHLEWDERTHERTRNTSRFLFANCPFYSGPIIGLVDEALGENGVLPIGRNEWAKLAVDRFLGWSDDKRRCDIRRLQTYVELQRTALTNAFIDGDMAKLRTSKKAIQLIASHNIAHGTRPRADVRHDHGVDLDEFGGIQAIHVRSWQPMGTSRRATSVPYSPHAMDLLANQYGIEGVRGKPLMLASLDWIDDVCETVEADAIKAKIGAAIGLVFYSDKPRQMQTSMKDPTKAASTSDTSRKTEPVSIDAGKVLYLNGPDGHRVEQLRTESPNSSLDVFVKMMMGAVCQSIRYPRSVAMLDFSGNYSITKAERNEARRTGNRIRRWFTRQFVAPDFAWFVDELVLNGVIPGRHRQEALAVDWTSTRERVVDPQKDNAARLMELASGRTTYQQDCADSGEDWRAKLEQIKEFQDTVRELGIVLSLSGKTVGEGQPGGTRTGTGMDDDERQELLDRIAELEEQVNG